MHPPAALVGHRNEVRGLSHALFTNGRQSRLSDDARPFEAREECGHDRSSAQPTPAAGGVVHVVGKCEGRPVRLPAGERRRQRGTDLGRRIQEAPTGPATEPLQYTPTQEVGAERLHVHRDYTHAVIGIERDQGANRFCLRANRRRVHDVGRAKEHVGNGHQSRPRRNCRENALEIDRDAVIARYHGYPGSQPRCEGVIGVTHRRKVERGHHHFVALRRKVDRRENTAHRLRDRGHHDHRAARGADQRRDLIAHRHRQLPPAFGPRAHAACLPLPGVLPEMVGNDRRHGAQRIRDEIRGRPENREGLAEP